MTAEQKVVEPEFTPPQIDCCESARVTGGAYHSPRCRAAAILGTDPGDPYLEEPFRAAAGDGHDEKFAAHRARREAERAGAVKVTWRKVSIITGGGWSGLGPDRRLVYVLCKPDCFEYGARVGGIQNRVGTADTLAEAKASAEEWLRADIERTAT